MPLRRFRILQGCIMLLLGGFLTFQLFTARLNWYIHERFLPLTLVGIVGLFWIGFNLLQVTHQVAADIHDHPDAEGHGHPHTPSAWLLIIALLPLLTGLLLPAQPLSTSALAGKGVSAAAPILKNTEARQFDLLDQERTILEWSRYFNSQLDPASYLGQKANVIGFVYHDPRLPPGQFLLSRFVIVCCTADAFALGMVVEWPESAALQNDDWVKVKGLVQAITLDGQRIPLIRAEAVEAVAPPAQPYLYP
ncbi:MAG: TIGR03943 family protein [Anaerolineales bacterium]